MPEIQRRRPLEPRESDAPEETPGSGARTAAIGCGIGVVVLLLGIGALGLVVSGWQRFGRPALEEAAAEEAGGAGTASGAGVGGAASGGGVGPGGVGPGGVVAPSGSSGGPAALDPLADMRRRYLPGPHVRVEGMIPSGRVLGGVAPTGPGSARSADTPWIVLGAMFERAAPPSPSPGGPSCSHAPGESADRPLDVVAGAPASASVRARDPSGGTDVETYIVAFDGYRGHFVLPARVMTELGSVAAAGSDGATVRFTVGTATRPDGSPIPPGMPYPVTMRIASVTSGGAVSAYVTRPLNVLPVGTGDVEVTLTMSQPTDLDLYVSDGSGTAVYYGNTTGPSGGHLDLDANAACAGNMGVNSEHIFWPNGRAPAGTYVVRVAHYESCVRGAAVEYRVTVVACGETTVLTGRFVGMGNGAACLGRGGDPNWCQDVVTFSIPSCAPPS